MVNATGRPGDHYIYGVFGKDLGGRHYQKLPSVDVIPA